MKGLTTLDRVSPEKAQPCNSGENSFASNRLIAFVQSNLAVLKLQMLDGCRDDGISNYSQRFWFCGTIPNTIHRQSNGRDLDKNIDAAMPCEMFWTIQSDVVQVMAQVNQTNRLAQLFGIIFCVFLACSAYSDNTTNTPTDFVAYFKQAISAPPDVEKYVVSHYLIKSGLTSYYAGARAGSNYFLQILSDSNALLNLGKIAPIAGQSGTSVYGFGQNQVSYGIGSNAMMQFNGVMFRMTRQFLDMGISEIDPESVKWTGDTFSATLDNGYPRYGKLSISNGLPFKLEISVTKDSLPYKMVEYTYPNSSASLGGFPSRMRISDGSDGKWKPVGEVTFYSVDLARRPLSEDYFAAAQFVGINIAYTNIYSNADLYVGNSKGQIVKAPDSLKESGGYTNSHARALIFLLFVLSAIVPITFFILQRKKTN